MGKAVKFYVGLWLVVVAVVVGWMTPPLLTAQTPADPQRQCFAPGPGDDNAHSDAAEASANDLAEAIVWLHRGGERPTGDDPQVVLFQQAIFRTLCTITTDWEVVQ